MESETTTQKQSYEYRAEMKQLLHLIVHSLYTHPEIFLRELVSNASDALNKVRLRKLVDGDVIDPDKPLHITIKTDPDAKSLSIEDSGIGMTREELIDRIGTVASSGTLEFLQELKKSDKPLDAQLIGQFGVGFYSCFMVADEVAIETRHATPGSKGYRWVSDGSGTFTIEEFERAERGTRVILQLKEDAAEFKEAWRVRQIVRKYSNFVDFPILLETEQINTVKALWRKRKEEISEEERTAFYKFVTNDFDDPLGHLHLQLEGRVNFSALLFIPRKAPLDLFRADEHRKLHLYANNVFIQEDASALLPDYLRFVRGVVDTEDLPLNVSREVTQASPAMARINKALTSKVLGLLEEWAKDEPEKYATFYREFGGLLTTGVGFDTTHRDRLIELVRFPSTAGDAGERTSLDAYVNRMKADQDAIYYLAGDRRDAVERHPNLEYFRRHKIEVLLLTDPVDVFTVPTIGRFRDRPLQSVEKADLKLEEDETTQKDALSGADADRLLLRFKDVLGDRVADVRLSRRLVDSVATLVVGEGGLDRQMERMMKLMDQSFEASKKVLEINPAHPLLKNIAGLLSDAGRQDLVKRAILQIFEGSQLIEGALESPAEFVERMTGLLVEATANTEQGAG